MAKGSKGTPQHSAPRVARSAVDGKFVTHNYANTHKRTTVIETPKKRGK